MEMYFCLGGVLSTENKDIHTQLSSILIAQLLTRLDVTKKVTLLTKQKSLAVFI